MQKPTHGAHTAQSAQSAQTAFLFDPKGALLWLRLGQSIRNLHLAHFGDDIGGGHKPKEPPEEIAKKIKEQTRMLQCFVSTDPSQRAIRQLLGVRPTHLPRPELVQMLALVLFSNLSMVDFCTNDSLAHCAGVLFSTDILEGRLLARSCVAELIDRKLLAIDNTFIRASRAVTVCLLGDNALLAPGLNDFAVRTHFAAKAEAEAKKKAAAQPPAAVPMPKAIYEQLRQIVIGQDDACKVLATRGWLHMRRVELLKQGQRVCSPECLFFISQHSGVGKTFLAESYGRLCSLPFVSFSSTDATASGFVGLEICEDSVKALIRSAGNPQEPATIEKASRGGIIFFDEWTKKRASSNENGRDISGAGVQQEVLRLMEGCKITLGKRWVDRETTPTEFDSNGVMFVFGGYADGFDKVIGKVQGRGMGFGERASQSAKDAYLSDALIEWGFIPEFVNRLSKVVVFRKLSPDDLVAIAKSATGIIAAYGGLLNGQGLSFRVEDAALRYMAEVSVETGMMARGMRLAIGALIEDLVFQGTGGKEAVFSLKEAKQAIAQVVTVCGLEGTG